MEALSDFSASEQHFSDTNLPITPPEMGTKLLLHVFKTPKGIWGWQAVKKFTFEVQTPCKDTEKD